MGLLRNIWEKEKNNLGPHMAGLVTVDPLQVAALTMGGAAMEPGQAGSGGRGLARYVGTVGGAVGANILLKPTVEAVVAAAMAAVGVTSPTARMVGTGISQGLLQTAAAFGGRHAATELYDRLTKGKQEQMTQSKTAYNYGNVGIAALKGSLVPAALAAGIGGLTAEPGHRMEGALQAGALGGLTGAAVGGLHQGAMQGTGGLSRAYQRGIGGDMRNMANTARNYVGADPVKNKRWDRWWYNGVKDQAKTLDKHAYAAGKSAALALYVP